MIYHTIYTWAMRQMNDFLTISKGEFGLMQKPGMIGSVGVPAAHGICFCFFESIRRLSPEESHRL